MCFEVVSGLRVNVGKIDVVFQWGMPIIEDLGGVLGCRVSALPLKIWVCL